MDLIDFSGPAFSETDNRVAALRLVQLGLTDAALFDPAGVHAQKYLDARLCTCLNHAGLCEACSGLQSSCFCQFVHAVLTHCMHAHHALHGCDGRRLQLYAIVNSLLSAHLSSLSAGIPRIPMEVLYKKNVLLTRGRFRPFTSLHNDMLMGAASQYFCEGQEVLSAPACSPVFSIKNTCKVLAG